MMPKKLTKRQEQKVKAKINRLLDEKNYPEAAKLMVALAISHIDPDEFARQFMEKIQEYKKRPQLEH